MAKWRCLHESIGRSAGLRGMSHVDALLYTWGLAQTDLWGLVRRDHLKALAFPYRSTGRRVQDSIDRLVTRRKLCVQRQNDHIWLHWCHFEEYQGEIVRKRRGNPPFSFVCPNDPQIQTPAAERGGTRRNAAERPPHPPATDSQTRAAERGGTRRNVRPTVPNQTVPNQTVPAPPTPSAVLPPSKFINAVMTQWPVAGGAFYGRYLRLEEEYGASFMWDVWLSALDSGKPAPPVNYLEAIARNAVAEGRRPGERKEASNGPGEDNRPTEIDGRAVVGWAGGLPVYAAPAKAT